MIKFWAEDVRFLGWLFRSFYGVLGVIQSLERFGTFFFGGMSRFLRSNASIRFGAMAAGNRSRFS